MRPTTLLALLLFPGVATAQHHHHHRHHPTAAAPTPTPPQTAPVVEAPLPAPSPPAPPPPAPPPTAAVVAPVVPAPPPPPPPVTVVAPAVRRFALELGPVIGLDIPTNALGVGPNLGLEVGGRVAVGSGVFAFALRGAWQHYDLAQTAAAPCSPMGSGTSNAAAAPEAPCVSMPTGGAYGYTIAEDVVRLSLLLSYRFFRASSAFNAYIGVAPQLALQRAETTSWNLITTETATRFGVGGVAGAQYRLGPGSAWIEVGYAWVPLGHRVSGDASIGAVTLSVGYRFALP